MVRKTRKDKKTKKTRKINTRKRQRRGGKKPGNWKIGYWSEEPMIHAKFMTENGNKKERNEKKAEMDDYSKEKDFQIMRSKTR